MNRHKPLLLQSFNKVAKVTSSVLSIVIMLLAISDILVSIRYWDIIKENNLKLYISEPIFITLLILDILPLIINGLYTLYYLYTRRLIERKYKEELDAEIDKNRPVLESISEKSASMYQQINELNNQLDTYDMQTWIKINRSLNSLKKTIKNKHKLNNIQIKCLEHALADNLADRYHNLIEAKILVTKQENDKQKLGK